jgi:hypothetical protein
MERTPRPNSLSPTSTGEDVDLGQLFQRTDSAINNVFRSLARLMRRLGNAILDFLFFLRRNLLWLLLGTLIGLGYGYYLVSKYGSRYTADLTVQANFNSTRAMYGAVDYFNALIGYGRVDELSRILKITPAEAASLRSMEANPVRSEIITSQIYQDQYIKNQFGLRPRMDTFWSRIINYNDFKSSLTKYDYPVQEITVTSTDPAIFPKIQEGIISKISSNELLQETKNKSSAANKETVDMLASSIKSLDTLSASYNKRLSNIPPTADSKGNSVMLMDGNITPHFPELDIYDKILQVSDELKNAQNKYVLENNVIQIYSPFSSMGQRENFFKQAMVRYGIFGLVAAFVILTGISLYKYLNRLEKERKMVRQ